MNQRALADDPIGTIYIDRWEGGARFVVQRGPASLCAYLGIPPTHPLAGRNYDSLPITAHGGLTYSGSGPTGLGDAHMFWYGWDYAHAGDVSFYDYKYGLHTGDREWTAKEVDDDSWDTRYDFKKLMALAEAIASRTGGSA